MLPKTFSFLPYKNPWAVSQQHSGYPVPLFLSPTKNGDNGSTINQHQHQASSISIERMTCAALTVLRPFYFEICDDFYGIELYFLLGALKTNQYFDIVCFFISFLSCFFL
jgi:hypothetical protein